MKIFLCLTLLVGAVLSYPVEDKVLVAAPKLADVPAVPVDVAPVKAQAKHEGAKAVENLQKQLQRDSGESSSISSAESHERPSSAASELPKEDIKQELVKPLESIETKALPELKKLDDKKEILPESKKTLVAEKPVEPVLKREELKSVDVAKLEDIKPAAVSSELKTLVPELKSAEKSEQIVPVNRNLPNSEAKIDLAKAASNPASIAEETSGIAKLGAVVPNPSPVPELKKLEDKPAKPELKKEEKKIPEIAQEKPLALPALKPEIKQAEAPAAIQSEQKVEAAVAAEDSAPKEVSNVAVIEKRSDNHLGHVAPKPQLKSVEPKAVEHKAAEPKAVDPKPLERKAVEPKSVEHKSVEPKPEAKSAVSIPAVLAKSAEHKPEHKSEAQKSVESKHAEGKSAVPSPVVPSPAVLSQVVLTPVVPSPAAKSHHLGDQKQAKSEDAHHKQDVVPAPVQKLKTLEEIIAPLDSQPKPVEKREDKGVSEVGAVPAVARKEEAKPAVPAAADAKKEEAKPAVPAAVDARKEEAKPAVPAVADARKEEAKPEVPSIIPATPLEKAKDVKEVKPEAAIAPVPKEKSS